jgi:hypothetical protein
VALLDASMAEVLAGDTHSHAARGAAGA